MKAVFIVLCFALTVFAQEQQEEHKNFTVGQRFGTLGLNIIPGLGSVVIMDDWAGAITQWVLVGTGAAAMTMSATYNSKCHENDWCMDFGRIILFGFGLYLWGIDAVFNITRSVTYDNPKYVQQLLEKNGNENFTTWQRFGTLGLNIIPGLGSIVVMDDWPGAITQWVLVGLGIASIDSFGIALITFDMLFNIYRSATYNNLKNVAASKHDGFHLSVLPNRHGKIMPYLLFNFTL